MTSERKPKRILIAATLILALGVAVIAFAAGTAIEYETIVPGNTAVGFTASKIAKTAGFWKGQQAMAAYITVEDNSINFSVDGTAPTQTGGTNVGHQVAAGQGRYIRGAANVANFLCIDRTAGSAATVKATFFYGGE